MTGPEHELYDFILAKYDGIGEETAKRHAARIHSDLSREFGAKAAPALKLPDVAPKLYVNRPIDPGTGRLEKAIDFYNRVWQPYADAGLLFQDQLRKLDPQIIDGIRTQARGMGLDPKSILPPPKSSRTDPVEALEKKRIYDREYHANRKNALSPLPKR